MKTHCPKGHPLEGDNVYQDDFARKCRTCIKAMQAIYRAKMKKKRQELAKENNAVKVDSKYEAINGGDQ